MFIFLLSALITLISIIFMLPVARKLKLVDTPSQRKSHLGNVPLIGGLSILIGVYVSVFGSFFDDNIFVFQNHKRRFIDSNIFRKLVSDIGFKEIYFIEKNNLSIYKNDNPVLMRIILKK